MNKQRSELKDKWYRLDKAALKEHVGDASRLVDGHESMIDIRRGVTPHGAASVPLMERVRAASAGGGGSESSGGGTEERGIGGRKSELAISRRIERLEIGVTHVGDGAVGQRGHGGLDGLRTRDHADVHGGSVGVIEHEDALRVSGNPRGFGAGRESRSEGDAVGAERGGVAGAGGNEGGNAVVGRRGGREEVSRGDGGVVEGSHVVVPDVIELNEQLGEKKGEKATLPMTRSIMRSRYSRGGTSEMPCLSSPRTKRFQRRSRRFMRVYFWR